MLTIKRIYEEYKQDVFCYLISLTHNPTLSEDLVSETFLSAIKSLPKFRGDSSIKTWLFSIARYTWYDYLRKNKEEISFEDLAQNYLVDKANLESMVIKGEIADKVLALLEKETFKTSDIVKMRIEGYAFYDIAIKHGISESSARVVDFRAKKKIREILEKEGLKDE